MWLSYFLLLNPISLYLNNCSISLGVGFIIRNIGLSLPCIFQLQMNKLGNISVSKKTIGLSFSDTIFSDASSDFNFILSTMSRQYDALCVDWAANANNSLYMFETSYGIPALYASSVIFFINSTPHLVPGIFESSFAITLLIVAISIFSLTAMFLSITFFSSLFGNPEVNTDIGKSLHFVSFLLKLDLPVNILISICSSNILLTVLTSPV